MAITWTEELALFVRENWQHSSAEKIALSLQAMGHSVSRNAVIGKAHRLGLDPKAPRGHDNQHVSIANIIARREYRAEVQRARRAAARGENPAMTKQLRPRGKVSFAPEKFTPRIATVQPFNIVFDATTAATCMYECSGDWDIQRYTFCGHKPSPNSPYCEHHRRIASLPTKRQVAAA